MLWLVRVVLTGRRAVVQWLRWRGLAVAGGTRECGLLNWSRLLLLLLLLLQYVQGQILARGGCYTGSCGGPYGRPSSRRDSCMGSCRGVVQHSQLPSLAFFLCLLTSQCDLQTDRQPEVLFHKSVNQSTGQSNPNFQWFFFSFWIEGLSVLYSCMCGTWSWFEGQMDRGHRICVMILRLWTLQITANRPM